MEKIRLTHVIKVLFKCMLTGKTRLHRPLKNEYFLTFQSFSLLKGLDKMTYRGPLQPQHSIILTIS